MHDTQTFLILAGLALMAIGIAAAKGNLVEILSAFAASKWASVDGEIESAGVSEGCDYNGANGSKRAIFRVVIRYKYRVGSLSYTSDKSGSDGRTFSSFSSAQRTANQYAAHKTIKVYVSPEDPTRSMIGVGMQWQWRYWLGLVVGVVLLGVGVVMLLARFGVRV
jgi:hypothetical protein